MSLVYKHICCNDNDHKNNKTVATCVHYLREPMYTQHKWFPCVSFSNIMDPDIWCCSQEMVFTKLRVKKARRSYREIKTSTLWQSNQVKHITPLKISLMNNYKNNNNNNNNNKLYLSVRYFSYEANWATYEIKRYICTGTKLNIYG